MKETLRLRIGWYILNLMYHPLLRDFQKVLNEAQILLTLNEEHKTVFGEKPPMIGWRKDRTLKDYRWPLGQKSKIQWLTSGEWGCPLDNDPKLALGQPKSSLKKRVKINNKDTKESKSALRNGKHCQVCHNIEETWEFEDTDGNKFDIWKGVINWNTDFTVYKFYCSSCSKQYIGSNITDFRYRFNNYKSAFRKISKSVKAPNVNQLHFHQHFKLPEHNGMDDWRVTLIDRADNRKELRRRESFWQYKLNTFFPHGLNERNVPGEYD